MCVQAQSTFVRFEQQDGWLIAVSQARVFLGSNHGMILEYREWVGPLYCYV